jgi:ABC-type lipoprotein release transport system permease subunit
MALGAAPADVTRMVVRQGVRLAAAGLVPGVALAYASGRALESLLASVHPWDAATFGAVVTLCLVMTGLGSLLPARRAARTDPIGAIRSD